MVLVTAAAALALIPSASIRLRAWGAQGHHIVARIAWSLMSPPAREAAGALLGPGLETFAASATWADEVRSARPETYNWHFVDIPVGTPKYDAARDCPPTDKGDCIIAALERSLKDLADPQRSQELKGESLKFVIHFIGDLHQPLHAIDNHDRGGNDVKVEALRGEEGRGTNLHAVWDTGLINLSDETEPARAARLVSDLTQHPADVRLNLVQWAEDSHALAEQVTYRYPGFTPAGPPAAPVTLDSAYRTAAIALIDRQLAVAGARLAAILNTALVPRR